MPNDFARILARISLITQLGLSLVTPPLLLLLGALWLQSRFGMGDWILLCAILGGIVSGICAALRLIRAELLAEHRSRQAENRDAKGKRDET